MSPMGGFSRPKPSYGPAAVATDARRRRPHLPQDPAMLPTARKLAFADVPVIDLAPAWSGDAAAYRALADEIAEVCGRVGFMYVRNHRIPAADVEAIFKTAADFHSLPLEA